MMHSQNNFNKNRCKTAKSHRRSEYSNSTYGRNIDKNTLGKYYQNDYLMRPHPENSSLESTKMTYKSTKQLPKCQPITCFNYQQIQNTLHVSAQDLNSMRKKGIHMSHAEPKDLMYTFSDFNKSSVALVDKIKINEKFRK